MLTELNKIPGPVKEWALSAAIIIALVIIFGCVDGRYVWGAALSLFHGGLAMLYLMSIGLSRMKSTVFVIFWSTLNVYNFCWAGNQIENIAGKFVGGIMARLRKYLNITAVPSNRRNGTIASVPKQITKLKAIAEEFPYFVLPLYCFSPILGIPAGVIFAKSLKLNMKAVLAILTAGNFADKMIWGFFLSAMMPYINYVVVPIVFFSLGSVVAAGILRLIYLSNGNNNHGSP